MTIVTPRHLLNKKFSLKIPQNHVPSRLRSPVQMSTPQISRTGLFSTPMVLPHRPHVTSQSTSKLQKSSTNWTAVKTPMMKSSTNWTAVKTPMMKSSTNWTAVKTPMMKSTAATPMSVIVSRRLNGFTPTISQVKVATDRYSQNRSKTSVKSKTINKPTTNLHPVQRQLFSTGIPKISLKKSASQLQLNINIPAPLTADKEEHVVKDNLTCSITTDAVSSITSDSTTVVTDEQEDEVFQNTENYLNFSEKCRDINDNNVVKYVNKRRKSSKKSKVRKSSKRRSSSCSCISCVSEDSNIILSTGLLFKSCVRFLLNIIYCVDTYLSCKKI